MGAIKSTRCTKGHRWTLKNTGTRGNGQRYCKACSLDRQRERAAKFKELNRAR
jgi:hypothetical protein